MNDVKSNNTIDSLTKVVDELRDKLDDLREYGEVSEVLVAALETQIKMIYKVSIANLFGVEKGLITDDYIDIATMITDEDSPSIEKNKEGYRHLTDEEIIAELTPLLDRDMLLDDDIVVDDIEEEVVKEDKVEKLFNELTAKEDEIYHTEMSQEEREKAFDELYEKCRQVLADVMVVEPSLISNDAIDLIMHGQIAEYFEGDKLIMKRIPYSEEIVRTVFRDYVLENKSAKEKEIREVEDIVAPTSIAPAENIPTEVVTEREVTEGKYGEKYKDRIEDLFLKFRDKEDKIFNSQISQEEKDVLMVDLKTWGKSVVAEVLGIHVEEVTDDLLEEAVRGQKVEYKDGETMVMQVVPLTEEQLKWIYDLHKKTHDVPSVSEIEAPVIRM